MKKTSDAKSVINRIARKKGNVKRKMNEVEKNRVIKLKSRQRKAKRY